MSRTYLDTRLGRRQQITAINTSAGAADADKLVGTGADGRLDASLMPVGIGADTMSVVASEALSAGNLVNIHNNAGTANVRKADATTSGKEADGFVLASVAGGATALVYFEGRISGLSGLTPGARQYLGTTAGTLTATAPSASGNVVQFVGRAISATELTFEPEDGDILA